MSHSFNATEQRMLVLTETYGRPICYFEALDAAGIPLVHEDDFLEESRGFEDRFFDFFEALNKFDRSRGEIAKIRMVHTHPARFLSKYHSAASLDLMLILHAVMEAQGRTEIEFESALLCADSGPTHVLDAFFGDRSVPLIKRIYRIPPHSLSYAAGDYWLNKETIAALNELKERERSAGRGGGR